MPTDRYIGQLKKNQRIDLDNSKEKNDLWKCNIVFRKKIWTFWNICDTYIIINYSPELITILLWHWKDLLKQLQLNDLDVFQFQRLSPQATITLEDVNDNCPEFLGVQTVLNLSVSENITATSLYNFTALDKDVGMAGQVTFSLVDQSK